MSPMFSCTTGIPMAAVCGYWDFFLCFKRTRTMFAASHALVAARTRSCELCNRSRLCASRHKGEERLTEALRNKFPQANFIQVDDISVPGANRTMYEIHIEAEELKNKRPAKQHRMVKEALQEEIKEMQIVQIFTDILK